MNNAEKFNEVFGSYATELWAKSEAELLEWLRGECGAVEAGGKIDPVTCSANNCTWRTKPITNADRIRTMTDEEIAGFLAVCDASRFRMRSDTEAVAEEKWRWLDWLKQEDET